MDHQPFEDWLLSGRQLTPDQMRQLHTHLRACVTCSALTAVEHTLHSVKAVTPVSGFTTRWRLRLAKQRKVQRGRYVLGVLILILGGLSLLAWYAMPYLAVIFRSPAEWLITWIGYLLFIFTSLRALGETGSILLRVLPGFVPPFAWMVIASTLSGLGLLWAISIWKITRNPRRV